VLLISALAKFSSKNGWITEKNLIEAISKQTDLPFVSLSMFHPMKEAVDAIPENMARRLELVPLYIDENSRRIVLAVSDPYQS